MKHTMKRTNKEEGERVTGLGYSRGKEFPFRLGKVVSSLVIFVTGVLLGLVVSSHFSTEAQFFMRRSSFSVVQEVGREVDSSVKGGDCVKEDFLDFKRFLKPENLTHSMSDEELFWRASMVPIKMKYPFKRVPKVAFMFLTRGPLPFLPLWERFFEGHEELFSVYVHALPGYSLNVTKSSAIYGRQIPSQAVYWESVTLADGERRLLANALLDFSNERFVLLSESCIPVYNFVTVYKYLTGSTKSFVESYDDPSRYGHGRYDRNMLPDMKLYQWRKGSQWFEMNRKLAANIISDTKYYTVFKKHCKPSCYPDEHYLPTFFNMLFKSDNSNRSVTWVNWSIGGPHQAAYGASDITESFIQSIRNNGSTCAYNSEYTSICYLFARKFAPSALEPLLNLTSSVMKF